VFRDDGKRAAERKAVSATGPSAQLAGQVGSWGCSVIVPPRIDALVDLLVDDAAVLHIGE